ncbi:MAG TPA: fumarylacetoacetate hydrolase family protein [Ilumatobacteraceae bacterium]|nr:fumarylacetoacetate hydrolase family protein [Ilumatobacteraceae bacterium]
MTDDFGPEFFAGGGLARLSSAVESGALEPVGLDGRRIGAPMRRPGKIVCIGLNYRDHAAEGGMAIPDEPIIFMKAPNTVVGPTDDVRIPRGSIKTDWEVELGVIIGTEASYVDSPEAALQHIAGYCVVNDVSEREYQLERGGQWDKGKSCDTFNPMGPWLVTADEVPDPQALGMWLDVNGRREQQGSTSDMIFSVAHIVWYVSQFMVLEPGDLLNTGTPAGVGSGKRPPRFLEAGYEMRVGIDGLGEHHTRTVATP